MSAHPIGTAAVRRWTLGPAWQAAIDGSGCEICAWSASVQAAYPVEVARLRVSRWLLGANQYIRGYSVLVLDRHVIELHELDPATRGAFIEDVADAGRALARVFDPIKTNIEMQGNVIPHLHCHLKPRSGDDLPGHARIFQDAEHHIAGLEDLQRVAHDLRSRLPQLSGAS